ncbi:MAG: hypothetical protein HUK20_02220 [Fibrobacter sp.]|nr:hypothetical protein [Fibrobacter sp.]
MENDSLNEAPQPSIDMPTPEQLGISISTGRIQPLTVGDTFDFPVTVSWSVEGSALLVRSTSSANAKGITQLGVSQESARVLKDGKETSSITFTYKLIAEESGNLNLPVMRFEIPTPMGTPLDLRSESVPIHVGEPFNPLPFIAGTAVGLCIILATLLRRRKIARAKKIASQKNAFEKQIAQKMMVLKQRLNTADSRQWLSELEYVCKEYVAEKFGIPTEQVNLENLVKEKKLECFNNLIDIFAQARYGGGKRDTFENKETWKQAMKLMGVEEET